MKKTFLIITFCLVLFACANDRTKDEARQPERAKSDVVEVLYFHGSYNPETTHLLFFIFSQIN